MQEARNNGKNYKISKAILRQYNNIIKYNTLPMSAEKVILYHGTKETVARSVMDGKPLVQLQGLQLQGRS